MSTHKFEWAFPNKTLCGLTYGPDWPAGDDWTMACGDALDKPVTCPDCLYALQGPAGKQGNTEPLPGRAVYDGDPTPAWRRWHGMTPEEALLDGLVPKSKLAAAEEVARLTKLKADGLEADLKHAINHRERLVAAEKEQSTRLRSEVLRLRDALRSKEDDIRRCREWKATVVTDRQSDDALSEAAERQNRVWSAHEVALAKVKHQTVQVALLVICGLGMAGAFLSAWRWL